MCSKTINLKTSMTLSMVVMFIYCVCAIQTETIYGSQIHTTSGKKVIRVNKCCEEYEILVGSRCTHINETDSTVWKPIFTSPDGRVDNVQIEPDAIIKLAIGLPICSTTQQWQVYHYDNSIDRLLLLPSGTLRHFIHHDTPEDVEAEPIEGKESRYHDYETGQYCLDKRLDQNGTLVSQFALICTPEILTSWTDVDFLIRKVINPIFHVIALICYLFVAIVYFVIPTLRDLTGNIVTTISVCFIVSTVADVIRIFTELKNHFSFLTADIFVYFSLLGAFFWLNSLGFYIWKMFKSRNVFLRVTDGRKYCHYSFYTWGSTLTLAAVALFAHFMFNDPKAPTISILHGQETIGWLGMAVFFSPIACIILVNILFYVSTQNIINKMQTYGRIHHKLRHNFRMFCLLFIIMTVSWLFLLMSWLKFDPLFYSYVIVNSLQAPLILYVTVFDQKHVFYLLRKSCCYADCICPCCRPEPECTTSPGGDWGDEMQAMDSGIY